MGIPLDRSVVESELLAIARLGRDGGSLDAFSRSIRSLTSRLCKAALSDQELFSTIADLSYRHPLGFEKVVLVPSDKTSHELRINAWEQAFHPEAKPVVHDHAWDLTSTIFQGSFRAVCYDLVDGSEYVITHASPFEHELGEYRLSRGLRTGVRVADSAQLESGASYHLPCGALHTFDPLEGPSSTIMLQSPFEQPSCRVLYSSGVDQSFGVAVERIHEERLRCLLTGHTC